jgi:hypothetical protein
VIGLEGVPEAEQQADAGEGENPRCHTTGKVSLDATIRTSAHEPGT